MQLSVVMPVLNEAAGLVAVLEPLQPRRGAQFELIVVDGGSEDDSAALAAPLCDQLVRSECGRARQMNAGAAVAKGTIILFLHADTRLPVASDMADLIGLLAASGRHWGRFDIRLLGRSRWLPVVAQLMNWRSRWSGIATGDQALFVERALFERLGGYADIALMEDVELCQRLKRHGRPLCLAGPIISSGRRWDEHGAWRTIALMWRLRLAWWASDGSSAAAERLRRRYYGD